MIDTSGTTASPARLPEGDYARVYLPYGRTAHLLPPYNTLSVLCLRVPGWRGEWLGTGSQGEHDRAASLPLCSRCQSTLSATLAPPETTTANGILPPVPPVVVKPPSPAVVPRGGSGEGGAQALNEPGRGDAA